MFEVEISRSFQDKYSVIKSLPWVQTEIFGGLSPQQAFVDCQWSPVGSWPLNVQTDCVILTFTYGLDVLSDI